MKKFLTLFFIIGTCFCRVAAQSATTSFNVNGIKVIFKPTQKKVIDIRIFFRGGVTNYTSDQAGIENLALHAAVECGTNKYSAAALKDTTDKYGILMSAESALDYGYIQLNCVSTYFKQGWDVFTDIVNNPVFDASQVNLAKMRMLTAIQQQKASPDAELTNLATTAAFENTPYATNPLGTEQSLNALAAGDLSAYYHKLLNKQKIFIVVVGNLDKQDLFEKILYAFDNISSSPWVKEDVKAPASFDGKLVSEARTLKTNYIAGIFGAPSFTSADYVPFRLAISGIGGNLYQSLRTQYHLTYTPWSRVLECRMPITTFGASTNYPKAAMRIIIAEIKREQENGYDQEWLQHLKDIFIAGNYFEDQSSALVCQNLGRAEVLGNWQYADDLPQLVNMVTTDQMSRVINAYLTGVRWAYLGNMEAMQGAVTSF